MPIVGHGVHIREAYGTLRIRTTLPHNEKNIIVIYVLPRTDLFHKHVVASYELISLSTSKLGQYLDGKSPKKEV